jgi:integral membrane protein
MNLSSPLVRYRIMAWVVGVMLIAVFVTIPFPKVDAVLGPIHGVLYIVYLATVVNMLIAYRVGLWYFVGMVVAGWCPFVSFVCERLITRKLAAPAPAVAPAAGGYTLEAPGSPGPN